MAHTTLPQTLNIANAVHLDQERVNLLLDAVYEADKIARVLPGLVPVDEDQTHYAVRAMAGRLLRLTDVLMDCLGSNAEKTNQKIREILSLECTGQG